MDTSAVAFICPRCRYSGRRESELRFCPRCGLPDVTADEDRQPLNLRVGSETVVVRERLALGDICNLYHCSIQRSGRHGVLKIARSYVSNHHVSREVETLDRLHRADREKRFVPFLPHPCGVVEYVKEGDPSSRRASLLRYHGGIGTPDELYTLEEVKDAYRDGIDPRDMAWIWRRLLTVLGFVHQNRMVHGLVTPDHVLIEPKEHKLVLIGWCGAVPVGCAPVLLPQRWRGWGDWERGGATATDVAAAAKSMLYVLRQDAEPAVLRHLQRAGESSGDAWKLLDDFDHMIDALWGPRRFRPLVMPARRA